MKPQRMAFAPIALLALAACSVSPAAPPQDDGKPSSMSMKGVEDASDVSPTEEVLVREVLEVMMKEMYPAPRTDSKSSLFGDGNALTVTVYVIDPKMRIAAERIVKRFTRRGGQGVTLGLTNKTHRSLTFKIGSTSWPLEIPLDAGERRSFHGSGAEFLGDAEVQIVDGGKANK